MRKSTHTEKREMHQYYSRVHGRSLDTGEKNRARELFLKFRKDEHDEADILAAHAELKAMASRPATQAEKQRQVKTFQRIFGAHFIVIFGVCYLYKDSLEQTGLIYPFAGILLSALLALILVPKVFLIEDEKQRQKKFLTLVMLSQAPMYLGLAAFVFEIILK